MAESATVLVVDDEEGILKLLETILSDSGHTLVLAESGEAAIDLAKKQDIHVALVDKNLPDMDGIELVKELSKIQPELVAAIMTGYGSLRSSLDALEAGVARYLLKPFDDIAIVSHTVWDILMERDARLRRRSSLEDDEDETDEDEEADSDAIKVIVADSSKDGRQEVAEALEAAGCKVTTATCAQEALLDLEGDSYEALVVAYDMGDMTADDVLLRAKRLNPDVAVIVTSENPTLSMTTSLIRRGAAAFIETPLKDGSTSARSILKQARAARKRMNEEPPEEAEDDEPTLEVKEADLPEE